MVKTNDTYSKPFVLSGGLRQGYPLSPASFTIVIEPLAAAIRAHDHINGVEFVVYSQPSEFNSIFVIFV